MQKVILLGLAIILSLLIPISSSQAATDAPPQDWDKLILTTNYMAKDGLIYAFIEKNKATKEMFTFADLRKYIDLGYLKDHKKTWTHQHERWVFKLIADEGVVTDRVFVLRTSFNSGKPLVLLDRLYADNKLVSDKETRQMLKTMLNDSLEQ